MWNIRIWLYLNDCVSIFLCFFAKIGGESRNLAVVEKKSLGRWLNRVFFLKWPGFLLNRLLLACNISFRKAHCTFQHSPYLPDFWGPLIYMFNVYDVLFIIYPNESLGRSKCVLQKIWDYLSCCKFIFPQGQVPGAELWRKVTTSSTNSSLHTQGLPNSSSHTGLPYL